MDAMIFDIQRMSFVDGPGIRTTVFFKGCNLRCKWCHNPESHNMKTEILFHEKKCTGCGRCKGVELSDEDFFCFNDAREICGKKYSVEEVFDEIIKDKSFYETSCGGVTFSGGECMLQIDFLKEILKKCKENGIHTAVDTAGHIPWCDFQKIIPYTDLFLYDIKSMDSQVHKKYTGVENDLILQNLEKLLKSKISVWIRIPVIPTVNDTEDNFKNIKEFFDKNGYPEKIELLPYHAMGEYKNVSLRKTGENFSEPDSEKIEKLKRILNV